MSKGKDKLVIDFVKSNFFRVLHVDDLGIAITPNLDIQVTLWNERASIPERLVYSINEESEIDELLLEECKNRNSVLREVEALFTIDTNTAREFINKLHECIEEIEELESIDTEETEEAKNDAGG
ncbi:MAG: hypothetical protein HC849_02320 [Oscillatoriales cyanobacterium RU_3_3]|nr:hypothetical protein [Oscillatoriales cyanobacterium RU_3_3]